MSEDKNTTFQTFGSTNGAGVCGPDGCSIADHHKQVAKKKENQSND